MPPTEPPVLFRHFASSNFSAYSDLEHFHGSTLGAIRSVASSNSAGFREDCVERGLPLKRNLSRLFLPPICPVAGTDFASATSHCTRIGKAPGAGSIRR